MDLNHKFIMCDLKQINKPICALVFYKIGHFLLDSFLMKSK